MDVDSNGGDTAEQDHHFDKRAATTTNDAAFILSSSHHHDDIPKSSSSSVLSLLCYRLRQKWKAIALGQFLSLLLASAGAAQATLHLSCQLSAPTFTMSLVYLGLSIIHLPILWCRKYRFSVSKCFCNRHKGTKIEQRYMPTTHDDIDATITTGHQQHSREEQLQMQVVSVEGNGQRNDSLENDNTPENFDQVVNNNDASSTNLIWSPRWYLLLAFFDVQANAITMLAFKYTTLTSVTLYDALAIPSAMLLSRFVVFRSNRRYRTLHYVGVIVCMIGVVLNVFQDYESDTETDKDDNDNSYPHKVWGDLCAITGGFLYGLNDVLTELTVNKAGDTTEYLGMLGVCGFGISMIQSLLFEREDILELFQTTSSSTSSDVDDSMTTTQCSLQSRVLLLSAFCSVTMGSYVGASFFLILSDAAFFNLSLLTGDLWSLLFSVVAERIAPQPLFYVALVAVLSGVVLYEMGPSPNLEKLNASSPNNLGASSNEGETSAVERRAMELSEYDNDEKDGIMVVSNDFYKGTKIAACLEMNDISST